MSKYAKDSYCADASEVLRHYHVDARKGLSPQQVDAATHLYGKNEIPPPPSASLLKLIAEQFEDLLVLILLAAAVISFILALFEDSGDDRWTAFVEPAVILIILVANAAVGVFQETNAAKAIEKLKQSEAREANVLRDGHTKPSTPSTSYQAVRAHSTHTRTATHERNRMSRIAPGTALRRLTNR